MTETLYDKTGAAFNLDHEHNGIAYVRPMVKVILQTTNYHGDDFNEEEDYEPAGYLVSMDRASLFDAPPVVALNEDVVAKKAELAALQAEAKKAVVAINLDRSIAERDLLAAQRQLAEWMTSHRTMIDLGKLLDGQILYPLSVRENFHHHSREIPRIPEMRSAGYLTVTSVDFEKGQKWVCKQYSSDSYGSPFRFYDTEEERSAVIHSEFAEACKSFRKAPNFEAERHTTGTRLHYGTLTEWVRTHPSLTIPADIEALKVQHDADLVAQRKAKLEMELQSLAGVSA